MTQSATHHWLSIDCWTCEQRSDKNSYRRPCSVDLTTMQCRSHSRRRTSECFFVPACSMDEYSKEKRTEKNLIVRSGISEAKTTNNKRLRLTFCIEAIAVQTRSIARPLCDSRASCTVYSSVPAVAVTIASLKYASFHSLCLVNRKLESSEQCALSKVTSVWHSLSALTQARSRFYTFTVLSIIHFSKSAQKFAVHGRV